MEYRTSNQAGKESWRRTVMILGGVTLEYVEVIRDFCAQVFLQNFANSETGIGRVIAFRLTGMFIHQ